MTRNISQSKPVKWIQAIMVATLTVVVIGIALLLLSHVDSSSVLIIFPSLMLELPGIYLHTWLLGDPFAKLLSPTEAAVISRQVLGLSLLFWFVFSFASAYFSKDKRYLIGAWFIALAGCTIWAILFA